MKRTITIGIAALVIVLIGGGVWFYWQIAGDTSAPSGTISAIPLAQDANAPSADTLLFQIVPAQTEVRFTISEVLRGQPATVVGKSNQVVGEIAIAPSDLGQTKMGVIQVNARTFETDDARRNRAIRNFILNTNTYEYITFTPTEIKGLSGAAKQGDTLKFQIMGNLTIRNITRPVVFDVTVQADSPARLSGAASATVSRADYELSIPDVPFVAQVGEQVRIDIDFVAEPISR